MLSSKTVILALAYLSWTSAAPIRREVPQEHSHEPIVAAVRTSLNLNNPDQIQDPIFGLLGNAAATAGLGKITDPDCLQQATADQAFTNAKAAGDVAGQVNALIFRALERNTGKVGLASVACTAITAVNPEIAAISQHQDPASTGAAATNKAIVLELAKQIAAVGGDPQDALKSGTFAPGSLTDNTGKGNTCDVATDAAGCIFSQNLLVEDATADEINAAVAGVAVAASASAVDNAAGATAAAATDAAAAATDAAATCAAASTVTVTVAAAAATDAAATAAAATAAAATAGAVNVAAVSTAAASAIGDFGKCTVPQVEFGVGFDNRVETSFEPVDQVSFNHGSAQNIDIILQFICDTLTNSCGADQTAKDTCATATAAADAQTAKTGAQADAFNAAFGITTNFAAVASVDDQGNVIAGTGSGAAAAATTAAAAAVDTAAAAAADTAVAAATTAAAAAAATGAAAAASGANLQTFTGALGGVTPPTVTANADGTFQVTGNAAFQSETNALIRSCDVQHNQCANAANASGNSGDLTVSACGDQQTQCNAAAQ